MRTTSAQTTTLRDALPRGITICNYTDGRPKPFGVRYGSPRKGIAFKHEADRNTYALKLAAMYEPSGDPGQSVDPIEWKRYREFRQRVGLSLEEIEQVLTAVKEAGLKVATAIPPGHPDAIVRRE